MVYTSHGHHIPDSPEEKIAPKRLARCGGPGLCSLCSSESGIWAEKNLLDSVIDKIKMSGEKGHKSIVQAARYQTKPKNVIAVQYEGDATGLDIEKWIKANGGNATWNDDQEACDVHPAIKRSFFLETTLGWYEVKPNYWVILKDSGYFTILPPDIFNEEYEPKE